MFAKVLREFGFSFDELMALSPRRFWFLLSQVDRLRAEERLAQMHLKAALGSPEAFEAAEKTLTERVGQIYVWEPQVPAEIRVGDDSGLDPEFDREALLALKARYAAG